MAVQENCSRLITIIYRGQKSKFKINTGSNIDAIQGAIRARFKIDQADQLILTDEQDVNIIIDSTLSTGSYILQTSTSGPSQEVAKIVTAPRDEKREKELLSGQVQKEKLRIVYISRTETFSAAHRLNSSMLTSEENKQTYCPCDHLHGHNYRVILSFKTTIDHKTGMGFNIRDLKPVITKCILNPLDHKNLDEDVPFFKTNPSTMENLCLFIWDSLQPELKNLGELYEVRVFETAKNSAFYRGE